MDTLIFTTRFITKGTVLVFFLSIMLVGCASVKPTPFVEASDYGEIGYSEKKLTDDQYQIIFTGNSKTDIAQAKDYALLHSARLARQKGYRWFEIIQSDSDVKTKTVSKIAPTSIKPNDVTSTCGILGCAISTATSYEGGQVHFEQVADKVISTMMIKMGKNNPDNPNRVFNVEQLIENLEKDNNNS